MMDHLFIIILLYLAVAAEVRSDCPPSWPTASERCLAANVAEMETGANDVNNSYDNLLRACNHYNATIECMDRLIRNCAKSGGDVTQATSIRDKMYKDLDYICGNNDTFIKFQKYSECFGQVAKVSAKCQESILTSTTYDYIYTEEYGYEYNKESDHGEHEKICEAVDQLLSCINDIVLKLCGAGAVELYDHMIISQLPSHITEACPKITSTACFPFVTTLIYIPFLLVILLLEC